jgi:aldose 1-epimerase
VLNGERPVRAEIGGHGLLELQEGPLHLALAPGVGGAITRLDFARENGKTAVLRHFDGVPATVLDAASFPLVPYCNRIRGGRFTFRGREVTLSRNMKGGPSPLHGQGWLSAWEVVSRSPGKAILRFDHEAGEWPWAYQALQSFELDPVGLSVTLTCRNLSDAPMPCGLGQHPYFPCGPRTRLQTRVGSAWTIDEKVLPVEKVPAAGRYDLGDRLACGQGLDNGFGEWGGTARMTDPDWPFEILMSSPDARFFQLYSPQEGGLFVAEPVSHANAALNAPEESWEELGMKVLEPGEEARLSMRIEVRLL